MCSGSSQDSGKPEEEDLPLFAVVNGEVSLTEAVRAASNFIASCILNCCVTSVSVAKLKTSDNSVGTFAGGKITRGHN